MTSFCHRIRTTQNDREGAYQLLERAWYQATAYRHRLAEAKVSSSRILMSSYWIPAVTFGSPSLTDTFEIVFLYKHSHEVAGDDES